MDLIKQCFRFSEMLSAFTRRELRQRYVGSLLGWPWPFIQPMIMMAVYYVVFVNLMGIKMDNTWSGELAKVNGGHSFDGDTFYVVLLCCGLLPWLATAEFLMRSVNTIPENGNLVKKVAFPSELLSVSLLVAYFINLMVLVTVFCIITFTFTGFVSPLLWMFPIVLILHAAFLLGLGYLLATANVFVRDVGQLAPLVINLWFFLTPIVYVKEILAQNKELTWVWIFDWNPMTYMVDLYRYALIYPDQLRYTIEEGIPVKLELSDVFTRLGIFAAIALVTLVLGYRTFMAKKHRFADEI